MSASGAPEITVDRGVTIIALGPEYENLDEHLLEDLNDSFTQAAANADPPLVVLDLSHTKFFGSAFIEILFRAWNKVSKKPGGRFVLTGLTSYCLEVIQVTHLDKLWEIFPSREAAVQAVLEQKTAD